MNKKTVAVIFGGQSSEHTVSRVSAVNVIKNIDTEKYYAILLGITKKGEWLLYNGTTDKIETGEWEKYATPAIISPDASQKGILKIVGDRSKLIPIDVVFPVLHGAWGEDGSIQGLLELAGIPYVGCGVLSSAVGMDKVYTKIIAAQAKIPQAKYIWLNSSEIEKASALNKIEKKLGYPVFIKPSNAGSSVGITKAADREELKKGLRLAAQYDRKILAEQFIDGREVECAVLGNEKPVASTVGEILAAADFYDFDAKYNNNESKTIVPAQLPEGLEEKIRRLAIKTFKAVDGCGLARTDFFIEKSTGRIIFNEINTMPGFTAISMYPMLWEACGKTKTQLINELIELALKRDNGIRG